MQAHDGASRAEDSARTAYEELMEEEDQAAAKAAAKKAKKLKQKAKKQQAAVDQTAAHPRSEDEQEYEQFSLPHSAADAAPETSAVSEAASKRPAASQATTGVPSALRALHMGIAAQSSASARAVCNTDQASGVQAYHLPLLNSRGVAHSEAAEVTEQVAVVQGGDSSNGRQCGVLAGAQNADGDAQFLSALFCCPITKVITIYTRRHAAFTARFMSAVTAVTAACGSVATMCLQVYLTLLMWLCSPAHLWIHSLLSYM